MSNPDFGIKLLRSVASFHATDYRSLLLLLQKKKVG
jgi:hypothetical protein